VARDREKHRLSQKKYYEKNKERIIARKKELESQSPEMRRKRSLWRNYGMTEQDFDNLFELQGRCCALCFAPGSKRTPRLCVDHCHETKKVRGLLCDNCNRALGLLGDKVEPLERAIEYLNGRLFPKYQLEQQRSFISDPIRWNIENSLPGELPKGIKKRGRPRKGT
jgi:hypothetical protein